MRLTLGQKPVREENGKIVEYVPNSTPYLLTDVHRDAPVGFCVKVGKTKKTYLVQRRHGSKVFQVKIGEVADYTLDEARKKAADKAKEIHETGANPNVTAREMLVAELSLGECFSRYRDYLVKPPEPAKLNTLTVFDKARKKLIAWETTKVKELSSDMILARFDEIAAKTPTTAEQTFRWANVAVEYALMIEAFEAKKANRIPSLTINPFEILRMTQRYRSRKQLEAVYEAKGVRKPMSVRDTLGPFLKAVWVRRKENRTGCDYLLTCLLLGTRKSEAAELKWREDLTDKEAQECSWVDIKKKKIFFFDTKNRTHLTLPIAVGVGHILSERQAFKEEFQQNLRRWVFPAKSKFSKTGHYSDGRSILKYICEEAEITRRAPHDFRRTFGAAAEELTSYAMVKRLLNHQDRSDVTARYTDAEWRRTAENLQRIEAYLLATAPVVYNSLLSPTYPPIPL